MIPAPAWRPRGRQQAAADDRAVVAAIVYMVQAGCSWWKLPEALFGISRPTVHPQVHRVDQAGLWERLHQQFGYFRRLLSDGHGGCGEVGRWVR